MHSPLIKQNPLPNLNNISIDNSILDRNENKIINRIKLEDSIDSFN